MEHCKGHRCRDKCPYGWGLLWREDAWSGLRAGSAQAFGEAVGCQRSPIPGGGCEWGWELLAEVAALSCLPRWQNHCQPDPLETALWLVAPSRGRNGFAQAGPWQNSSRPCLQRKLSQSHREWEKREEQPFWAEGAKLFSASVATGRVRWHQWGPEQVLVGWAVSTGEPSLWSDLPMERARRGRQRCARRNWERRVQSCKSCPPMSWCDTSASLLSAVDFSWHCWAQSPQPLCS